jgi:hypothetical protein
VRIRVALGLAALAGAALLVVLGQDVRRWPQTFRAGDLRYRSDPFQRTAWRPSERIPFGAARRLVGADDDLAYRRAVQRFRSTRPDNPGGHASSRRFVAVIAAERALMPIMRRSKPTERASTAANLLGLLAFDDPAPEGVGSFFSRSERMFRRAVVLDARDEEAKVNLELLLRLAGDDNSTSHSGVGGRHKRDAADIGAGLAPAGQGY